MWKKLDALKRVWNVMYDGVGCGRGVGLKRVCVDEACGKGGTLKPIIAFTLQSCRLNYMEEGERRRL